MVQNEQPFEFETLDELWSKVQHLKPNECLEARRPSQGNQGPINEIKEDPRFKDFKVSTADYKPSQHQVNDRNLFRICRKATSPHMKRMKQGS